MNTIFRSPLWWFEEHHRTHAAEVTAVFRPVPHCEDKYSAPPALFNSPKLLGAAVSLFNLGQTDGDSVCGDYINISSPKEEREEETKDLGQKLGAHRFFSLPPLIFLSPLSFSHCGFSVLLSLHHSSLSPLSSLRAAKDGCRLRESSHVSENS